MTASLEQQARELLERMGLWEAWTLTADNLKPLMELIEKAQRCEEERKEDDRSKSRPN
jgi:hypothetical protein